MNIKRFSFLASILTIFCILASTQISNAQSTNSVEVLEIDSYSEHIKIGEFENYRWTIRNTALQNITYKITISVNEIEDGWSVTLSENEITLAPYQAHTIIANVTPLEGAKKSFNMTVIFTVYQDDAIVQIVAKNALTTLVIPKVKTEKKVLDMFSNPLPSPLNNDIGVFLLDILSWLGIAALVTGIIIPTIKAITRRTKTQLDDIFIRITTKPAIFLIFLYGLTQSLLVLDAYIPEWFLERLDNGYSTIAALVLAYVGYRLFKDIIIYYGKIFAKKTETKLDDILIPVFEKIGMVVIILFVIGTILNYFSIDLTMFVAGGVVTSMVIAFAAQETLSNFFAGIFILVDRPFKEGDWVILPGDELCRVEKIGLRSTKFYRYYDNTIIALPNNKLMSEKIVNFSEPDDIAKVRAKVGVAYGTDLKLVEETLLSVAKACPHVIKEGPRAPSVWIDKMGDSSVDFTLLTYVNNRDNRWDAEKFLLLNIYNEFFKKGIEIPFPQRVIHIVNDEKKENAQKIEVKNIDVKTIETKKEDAKKIDKKI